METFETVVAQVPNIKNKHFLRMLVEKVLVHDRDRFEIEYCLIDGSSMKMLLKTYLVKPKTQIVLTSARTRFAIRYMRLPEGGTLDQNNWHCYSR